MQRQAYVAAVGMTRFAKHRDRRIEELGQEAVLAALADTGLPLAQARDAVQEVFCGSGYGGPLIGQRILRQLGMTGIPVTNVENACSSGATALREGCWAVGSGRVGVALVLGVDQLTRFGGGTLPLETTDLEVGQGMVMPGLYAMRANRYLHETGATAEDLAQVAVKSRAHAARNPNAQYRTLCSVAEVLQSRPVAAPLTLFMCSPSSDGAAAAIITTGEQARRWGVPRVRLAASVLQSGHYKTGFRDLASSELGQRSSRLAYEQAGLGPDEVDVAEVHDAFTIAELMYYEAFGFCRPGDGAALLRAGETSVGGRIPVNTGGGLLSRGHPIGATGVAQVCELVWQLRGEAERRQVDGARVGMTHCSGGGISGLDHGASTVHLLVREEAA